jgi:hypothetical protein
MVGATEDAFRPPMGNTLSETAFEDGRNITPDKSASVR